MNPKKPHYIYNEDYISLWDLELGNLPKTVELGGRTLTLKNEFHISLICIRDIAILIDPDNKSKIGNEIIDEFKRFTQEYPLDKYDILDDVRLVQRHRSRTIIVMVSVPHIGKFFDRLRTRFDTGLPTQPTHPHYSLQVRTTRYRNPFESRSSQRFQSR
ncbi:MAG TPA: hypothetical protein VMR18_02935 [Candidatus Saccharimonadales bacterium]|nr:hypothetical protein [Candidatus Saccharimonadales bacterium]